MKVKNYKDIELKNEEEDYNEEGEDLLEEEEVEKVEELFEDE